MFRLLKKIYRLFIPKKKTEIFNEELNNISIIEKYSINQDLFKLELHSGIKLVLRDFSHSDLDVFKQIFLKEEYKLIMNLLKENHNHEGKIVVIDAGANIGLTTLYLGEYLKNAFFYVIEPSKGNFDLLQRNLELNDYLNRSKLFQRALHCKMDLNFNISNDFRDMRDWGHTTVLDESGEIQSITIDKIIEDENLDGITLLKIDIEGAERFLFDDLSNCKFLEITKYIAIEVHEEFISQRKVIDTLINYGFLITVYEEFTIGINKYLISK